MANLFELTSNFKYILDHADELDEQTLNDTLESIQEPLEDKVDNTVGLLKSLKNDIDNFKKEEQELKKRRQTIENNFKRVKEWSEYTLSTLDVDKLKGNKHELRMQKNSVSVSIPDESKVPEQYLIPQPPKINKTEIKEDLKNGDEYDWAELVQTESLRYR
ncbi:siphovirus Gp157 family protein [Vagococcus fluvialis]|uniref:siphovirus Gp157 family protein n=1 Tax=Vagococcus fluvialis TaxID=2738 RepID=UPI00288FC8CB|nr:siphovirus Gp157 family protein [Vagococcus fluvialis]MDT2783005.1 siphovirus Gp157 family protein [Vagococcus fluvialis]